MKTIEEQHAELQRIIKTDMFRFFNTCECDIEWAEKVLKRHEQLSKIKMALKIVESVVTKNE